MPQINNIPEVLYQPNQPYQYHYDNLPLRNILKRIDLVNSQVDVNTDALRGARGTAGSLTKRLDMALEPSGRLKASEVDFCNHSIESHEDTDDYVRMTSVERAKLSLVENSANKLYIKLDEVVFSSGTIVFANSDTVTFSRVNTSSSSSSGQNIITANVNFPLDSAHRHYYGVEPVLSYASSSSSGVHYKTTISDTPFMEGTLRVYVNGIRLSESSVNVWTGSSWVATNIASQDHDSGLFSLNRALGVTENIRIDFDESFV